MSRKLVLHSTQIPDVILDEWLPVLSMPEFKIIMLVARKTYGWGKESDRIGLAQMAAATGMARTTAYHACNSLEERGMLIMSGSDYSTPRECRINLDWDDAPGDGPLPISGNDTPPISGNDTGCIGKKHRGISGNDTPPISGNEPTRNKEKYKEKNPPIVPQGDGMSVSANYDDDFTQLWQAYPKAGRLRSDKPKAYGLWRKFPAAKKNAVSAALVSASATEQFSNFTPALDSWLRGKWEAYAEVDSAAPHDAGPAPLVFVIPDYRAELAPQTASTPGVTTK